MQVSQLAEQDSFAVIGGGEARKMQINASSQVFRIFSDTLYSDKPRAISREVICNGWDAHIVAGLTDKPLEITLTECELSFQDFGTGIADEDMAAIYCTLFGSTKQNDEAQTGGFGLGSKSPFAYTDHFMVTSCHKGTRRIYALTAGDEESEGIPTIKEMGRAPCGELSGITVTIPIKATDQALFNKNIRAVVLEGGIKANLNGKVLQTRDYTALRESGIGLFSQSRDNSVLILYGNVLYPLDANDAIRELVHGIEEWCHRGFDLIIAAPPSSVTVTPAREALGYNPRTIATLQRILRARLHEMRSVRPRMVRDECLAFIQTATRFNVMSLYDNPDWRQITALDQIEAVIGTKDIARYYARRMVLRRDYAARDLSDLAARYFRDKGKLLRGTTSSATSHLVHANAKDIRTRRARNLTNFQEQHQYGARKLLRMVPNSLWNSIYYKISDDGMMRLTKSRNLRKSVHDSLSLTISYNRDAALMSSKRGFFLIDPKITPEQIAAIQAAAPMFRFTINVLEKAERVKLPPKPRAVKVRNKYRSLEMKEERRRPRAHGYVKKLAEPTVETPSAYMAWSPSRYKQIGFAVKSSGEIDLVFDYIRRHFPNTVLAIDTSDIKALNKADIPTIESLVLKRLEDRAELSAMQDGLYVAQLMAQKHHYHRFDRTTTRLFLKMMCHESRSVMAALGAPNIGFEHDEEIKELWKFAAVFFSPKLFDDGHRGPLAGPNGDHDDDAGSAFNEFRDNHTRFMALCDLVLSQLPPSVSKILNHYAEGTIEDEYLPHLAFHSRVMKHDIEDLNGPDQRRVLAMIEAEIERLAPPLLDENGDQL